LPGTTSNEGIAGITGVRNVAEVFSASREVAQRSCKGRPFARRQYRSDWSHGLCRHGGAWALGERAFDELLDPPWQPLRKVVDHKIRRNTAQAPAQQVDFRPAAIARLEFVPAVPE
jgi:hypothetical protein